MQLRPWPTNQHWHNFVTRSIVQNMWCKLCTYSILTLRPWLHAKDLFNIIGQSPPKGRDISIYIVDFTYLVPSTYLWIFYHQRFTAMQIHSLQITEKIFCESRNPKWNGKWCKYVTETILWIDGQAVAILFTINQSMCIGHKYCGLFA